jgi:hypothetical protein
MNKRQIKKKGKKASTWLLPLAKVESSDEYAEDYVKWLNGYKRRIAGI